MTRIKVWDPLVRVFHWSLVTLFAANALFTNGEHKLHRWIGYTILALIAVRILWGFAGRGYARFASFPPSISAAVSQVSDMVLGRTPLHRGHTPLGAYMIYNLLLTLGVICVSGYLMTTDMFWGVEWPETVHKAAVTWAEISVVLHVSAVIIESRRTRINLPSAMITGYKKIPAELD
ncbi:cytochrome b/b6 domain-containing protein [Tropicimonas sp. IMCC34043]|uniref:cytochrome b/b6 domain-containing protein n=1 Tax=Tropicimonas sp. IMCC34043 TaxID=2248760 RepID=UPI000E259E89|nr:cytochrome b/b6 domain-containing protein [Tropicimonas sp. IMCC34043]